ncbi:MAG: serine hydrolase [Phenylobacterium sp.]|jgi:CubicO group peptidase (beta-lactamase class C family)|uniref:serine hydrolase domain-containing protein n=1 Tax=Phenylobacterium sp. TaxID=1871053 RepID=UPI002A35A93E|nr:serine hydrolase [Phenylobacterium sp.]MDX9996349.1 serine hydrolase [Phenylobacterium sp.]
MPRLLTSLAAALAALPAAAFAQEAAGPRVDRLLEGPPGLVSPRHAEAQRAGMRALHFCTGLFASEMPREVVERTTTRAPAGTRMEIDEATRTVSVHYRDDMPPRIAVWRPLLGCTQLPIGATMELAKALPRPPAEVTVPDLDSRPWPMGDASATARLPKARAAALERVLDEAFRDQQGEYRGNTWGVVVVKDGKIVAERYDPGFGPHVAARTNSMCKSVAASLVGVGVRQGLVDLHRKAPLAEWRRPGDPRGEITLDHMMHMASGLYTEAGGNPQGDLYQSGAAAAEVSALNMVDSRPGERFVYAGSDTILLVRALRQAVNDDTAFMTWPHREFLWKLGMTRTILETDWNDDFLISGQCWSTARDFGRFGMLYLADGMWNGERLLPEGWTRYVSTPAPAQPASAAAGGARYGGQFWIYGGNDGLPDDAFSPGGALGQYAMIVPSKNLVVVRRGLDVGEGFRIAKFSADVIAALEGTK